MDQLSRSSRKRHDEKEDGISSLSSSYFPRPSQAMHAHFDCFSGAAGDMILAACFDAAGSSSDQLLQYVDQCLCQGLPALKGEFELTKQRVWRGSGQIAATYVQVKSVYQHKATPPPQKEASNKANEEDIIFAVSNSITSSSSESKVQYPELASDDKKDAEQDNVQEISHEHHHQHDQDPQHDHDHDHDHSHSQLHSHEHSHSICHRSLHDSSVENEGHSHSHSHTHSYTQGPLRNLPEIRQMLEESSEHWIPAWVRTKAIQAFTLLAEAEAAVHGAESIDTVCFHEVGAVDSIVDTVGSLLALHALGAETFSCSRLPLGEGTVRTQHGLLPTPPPAALRLLTGMPLTAGPPGRMGELVTPTGAALLRALMTDDDANGAEFKPVTRPPPFTLQKIGTGAGSKDFAHPNILRLLLGDSVDDAGKK